MNYKRNKGKRTTKRFDSDLLLGNLLHDLFRDATALAARASEQIILQSILSLLLREVILVFNVRNAKLLIGSDITQSDESTLIITTITVLDDSDIGLTAVVHAAGDCVETRTGGMLAVAAEEVVPSGGAKELLEGELCLANIGGERIELLEVVRNRFPCCGKVDKSLIVVFKVLATHLTRSALHVVLHGTLGSSTDVVHLEHTHEATHGEDVHELHRALNVAGVPLKALLRIVDKRGELLIGLRDGIQHLRRVFVKIGDDTTSGGGEDGLDAADVAGYDRRRATNKSIQETNELRLKG